MFLTLCLFLASYTSLQKRTNFLFLFFKFCLVKFLFSVPYTYNKNNKEFLAIKACLLAWVTVIALIE